MTKLCPRGKAAAKRKFKVYPSAYANAYASKICAGKIKDPSGVKRKDFRGPKPAGAKKGALMIIIGVGKKKKVDKKMGGGMPTAGGMSAMGRLQKARMMNKGGESKGNVSKSEMQVRSGREKAKKVIGKLKNFKNQSKGFLKEMAGFEKGGGADTGRVGEMKSKIGVLSNKLRRRGMRLTKRDIEKAGDLVGSTAPYIKKKMGGDAKIKKVIKGLNKASALHKGQAKSLQTVVKKSGGGMARGGGAAIRGNKFQGVF